MYAIVESVSDGLIPDEAEFGVVGYGAGKDAAAARIQGRRRRGIKIPGFHRGIDRERTRVEIKQ